MTGSVANAVTQCEGRLPGLHPSEVIEFLADVATCDGTPNRQEIALIRNVALEFGLDADAWPQLQADLGLTDEDDTLQAAYETLGLQPGAAADEVKSAYRRLMREYHPDTVTTLPKGFRDFAAAKTIEIRAAYDLINRSNQQRAA